ncbi:hypothetical protein MMC30_005851 [Trapelia coarctata]|nr:hypothetical protein [Trapelia coarctata]
MASNDIHLEPPDFTADSIDNHLRQLHASPPRSLLPAAEITVDERKGARDSAKRGSERSVETMIRNPLHTSSRQGLPGSYANNARDAELEHLADDERIKRILQATAKICTHSRYPHSRDPLFTRHLYSSLSFSGAATDKHSNTSDAEPLSNQPLTPVTVSPRLHRTPASRELRELARLSAESTTSEDTMFSCAPARKKLFCGKREPPKVSVTTTGIEPQGENVHLESNNSSATPGRRVDGNSRPTRPDSYVYNHRLSQIGVAVPMDENTGFEPSQYLGGARSDLDHTQWIGQPTEDPPISTATATTPMQAFETGNQGRERILSASVTLSSSSRDVGKTVTGSGNLHLAPLASNPRDDGKPLNMSTTDKPQQKSSQSAIPPGSYRSINYSHLADEPSKIHGKTALAGSSSRGVASNGVWEGPYDFNVLIDTLDSIISYANARMNSFLRPILTRLEPEMINELEHSHLYVQNKIGVFFQGRLSPGRAAQEAIRTMLPANRQVFVKLLAAVLIAQDTLAIIQEMATRDANGPPRVVETHTTCRGKAKTQSFVDRLEKIDEGLGVVCREIMKNVWGSYALDTTEVLHGTALAAVRAALRS